jgi:hypothetical protein
MSAIVHTTKITIFRPKYILLLFLIIAFPAMQWTTSHVHLAGQHIHDGTCHQHQAEEHTRQFSHHHQTAIDFSHQENHVHVIDIEHEYRFSGRANQQKNASAGVVSPDFHVSPPLLPVSIKTANIKNSRLNYFDRSPVKPRGPPHTS